MSLFAGAAISNPVSVDGLKTIFARNCIIKRIEKSESEAFLDRNHRLGSASCRYRYGMFVSRRTGRNETSLEPGTLVAVCCFSNARRMRDGSRSYEWVRYASLVGYRVQGAMGRMLSRFVRDVRPDDVMTYADPQSPDGGKVYLTLGFEPEGEVYKPGFVCEKYRLKITSN